MYVFANVFYTFYFQSRTYRTERAVILRKNTLLLTHFVIIGVCGTLFAFPYLACATNFSLRRSVKGILQMPQIKST